MFHANFHVNFYANFDVNFCANFYVKFRANFHDCELFMHATYSSGEKPFHANMVPDSHYSMTQVREQVPKFKLAQWRIQEFI